MGKIPQVNGKINRGNRKRAGKCRPASETVTADRSDQLADQNVVTDVRGDVFRIGFALYHDRDDVARLRKIIEQLT